MAVVNMDLDKEKDTILYAKFLTRIDDKVRWSILILQDILINYLLLFLLLTFLLSSLPQISPPSKNKG